MVRITKRITAAREVYKAEWVRWIPLTTPRTTRMANQHAEHWRNRQRSTASLRLNRQLHRS